MSQHAGTARPHAQSRPKAHPLARRLLLVAVALAILIALPFIPWKDLGAALIAADPLWLGLAMLANLAVLPFWVRQWQLLALPGVRVSWPVMFEIVALSAAAKTTLSTLGGGASALTLLTARGGLTLIGAASLMALDQLLVGLAKLAILALAVSLAPLPPAAAAGALAFTGLVAAFLAALAALAFNPAPVSRLAERWHGPAARLAGLLARFAAGLNAMRSPARVAETLVLALVKKAAEVAAALAVQLACGIEPSLVAAILAIAAVSLTTAVPVIPGNLGTYAATVFLVYEALGIPTPQGLAAGLLQHATVLIPSLLAGYGALALARLGPRGEAAP